MATTPPSEKLSKSEPKQFEIVNNQSIPNAPFDTNIDQTLSNNIANDIISLSGNEVASLESDLLYSQFVDRLKQFIESQDFDTVKSELEAKTSELEESSATLEIDKDSLTKESIESGQNTVNDSNLKSDKNSNINETFIKSITTSVINVLNFDTILDSSMKSISSVIKSLIDGNAEDFKKTLSDEFNNSLNISAFSKVGNELAEDVLGEKQEEIDVESEETVVPQEEQEQSSEVENESTNENVSESEETQVEKEPEEEPSIPEPESETQQKKEPDPGKEMADAQRKLDIQRKRNLNSIDKNLSVINSSLQKVIELNEDVVEEYDSRKDEDEEDDEKSEDSKKKKKEKDSDSDDDLDFSSDDEKEGGGKSGLMKKLGIGLAIASLATLLILFRGYSSHAGLKNYLAKHANDKDDSKVASEINSEFTNGDKEGEVLESDLDDADESANVADGKLSDADKIVTPYADKKDTSVEKDKLEPQKESEESEENEFKEEENTNEENALEEESNGDRNSEEHQSEEERQAYDEIENANVDIEQENDVENLDQNVEEFKEINDKTQEIEKAPKEEPEPEPEEPDIDKKEIKNIVEKRKDSSTSGEELQEKIDTIKEHLDSAQAGAEDGLEKAKEDTDTLDENIKESRKKTEEKSKETQDKINEAEEATDKTQDQIQDNKDVDNLDKDQLEKDAEENKKALEERDKKTAESTVPKSEMDKANNAAEESQKALEESSKDMNQSEEATDKDTTERDAESKLKETENSTSENTKNIDELNENLDENSQNLQQSIDKVEQLKRQEDAEAKNATVDFNQKEDDIKLAAEESLNTADIAKVEAEETLSNNTLIDDLQQIEEEIEEEDDDKFVRIKKKDIKKLYKQIMSIKGSMMQTVSSECKKQNRNNFINELNEMK